MSTSIPSPDPQTLVPPLLAMLPASFASSRPPPELLPRLSPILQQRLNIHTSSPGTGHESWLRLLCWDASKAETLKEQVENANFEPHPSSGEIEVGDVGPIKYKQFDVETLRAQIPLPDWELTAMYVWCTGGAEGDAWKLAELLPFDSDLLRDATWLSSVEEATKTLKVRDMLSPPPAGLSRRVSNTNGEDEDYWAMYDQTPSQTPARHGSVNPTGAGVSEEDYYARYGDVQPALDSHDPDEAQDVGETSLNGNALQELLAQQDQDGEGRELRSTTLSRFVGSRSADDEDVVHVSHPIPSSPSSRAGSDTVARLERSAERYNTSEIAIRQHISTTMKSMYRLAKASGLGRDDFERLVQRELDTLSIFDADD